MTLLGSTATSDAGAGDSAAAATLLDDKAGAATGADVVDTAAAGAGEAGDGEAGDTGATGGEGEDGSATGSGDAGDDAVASATAAAAAAKAGEGKDGKAAADAAKTAADSWRLALAGKNADALKTLSRFKTPDDFYKDYEQKQKALSKRAEVPKLPENATIKQIAEYRKTMGVPEVAAGAKPEDIAKAYGIAPPKDYAVSKVEQAMLADFAAEMHAIHTPAAFVKQAADTFFKAQAANAQNLNLLDADRAKTWTTELRTEWGKNYDQVLAAAKAQIDEDFKDNAQAKNELLNARMPGGGRLGDNPTFIKMWADKGLANGKSDPIERSELEAQGGASLAEQQIQLERLRTTDPQKYDLPEIQKKLSLILDHRIKAGEIDPHTGEPTKKRRAG